LNGSPGFVHWFRNPRLFGKRLRIGYDLWNVTRNRLIFSSLVPNGEVAEIVGGYTTNLQRYNFFIDRELIYWFNVGVGFEFLNNKADESQLSDDVLAKNNTNGLSIPNELDERAYYAYFRLGRLNFINYLVEGIQTDWNFRFADDALGGTETSKRLTQTTRAFFLLPYEQNIGFNFTVGHSDSSNFQNSFFVGGLNNVRGFQDGQFIEKNFWRANTEYRVSSYKSHWFVLQHNFFYDVGNVSDELNNLFSGNSRVPFHSAGVGVRLISPAIFRFNLRIDYAKGLNYNQPTNISFGLQQFF
ncbi:MAG: outer membrane protein assembly factor, partial [Bdellovibrionales bacterium]|nr:outer membrane protein assembly factor [Bdellovibrionales bacterium]